MTINEQKWTIPGLIGAFFPIRLLLAHVRFNIFSVLFWVVLFLIVNDSLAYRFGVPLLFLSPEYLGEISPWSFYLVGFGFGGFIMAFNTYSYIRLGPHFPFLTSLNRPFFKFCINNALIPAIFIVFYIIKMARFQRVEEFATGGEIVLFALATVLGAFTFIIFSIFYFFPIARRQERRANREQKVKPISSMFHKDRRWYETYAIEKDRTYFYIGRRLKVLQSRSVKHLEKEVIQRTFAKNRINASLFEILTICSFFVLGLFNGYDILEVPASMSIVLLMTIILMLYSALQSWFGRWVYPLLLILILGMDFLSSKTDVFNYTNYAYGLNYNLKTSDEYSIDRIHDITHDQKLNDESLESYIQTLNNWKKRTGEEKPKLIIVNTSGGGSRSSLWTLTVLQRCDESLNGKLVRNMQLMTGASGGMIGAAYFREIALRAQLDSSRYNLYDEVYRQRIGMDMLNKLSFMATTNDIFIRYQECDYNSQVYTMDRGFSFEEQLHKNTNSYMDHTLGYYEKYEKNATIPTMIFSPTIVNDGRRLLISSQQLNFLTSNYNGPSEVHSNENIDYHSILANQNTQDIRFSSVLRSSATFPFVMPMITLPTEPQIQLMDAGIRDNYGGKTMMEYLFALKPWIEENTSGVVVIQIRDTKKLLDDQRYSKVSFLDKITLPFGNVYKNFPRVQDYNQEELMKIGAHSFEFPVDVVSFNLREHKDQRISLSWHLTTMEKEQIEKAFDSKNNQQAFKQLKKLL